jgi:hypothetical protein
MTNFQELAADMAFLMNGVSDGVWRIDADGCVIGANRVLCDWMGRAQETVVGRPAQGVLEREGEGSFKEEGIFTVTVNGNRYICISRASAEGWLQIFVEDRRSQLDLQPPHGQTRMAVLCTEEEFSEALDDCCHLQRRMPFAAVAMQVSVNGGSTEHLKELGAVFRTKIRSALRGSDFVFEAKPGLCLVLLRGLSQDHTASTVSRLERALQIGVSLPSGPAVVSCTCGWAHSSEGSEGILTAAQESLIKRSEFRVAA